MKSLLLKTFFVLSILTIGGVVDGDAQNHAPNPYTTNPLWGELPEGREWGSTSAIYPGPDGTIWVGERCGQNTCVDRTNVDPILKIFPSNVSIEVRSPSNSQRSESILIF